MNSQEIDSENYIKVIAHLRQEIRISNPTQLIQSNPSQSFSILNFSSQQQQFQDRIEGNSIIQQPVSQLTVYNEQHDLENLKQAEEYLKKVYRQIFPNQKNLEERLKVYEMLPTQLKYKVSQPQICQALSFNYNNSLLAITQEKNIEIFNFNNGNIDQIAYFEAHTSEVSSLVFSKKKDYLLSGGDDCFIYFWEESNQQKYWKKKISLNTKSPINYMVLNKKENLIIVGNKYGFMQIWLLDIQQVTIKIIHEMRKVHEKSVYGISLNPSENRIITCSQDKKIILWSLDEKGMLQKLAEQERESFVSSIHFLNDKKIILSQNKKGLIELKLENDKFLEHEEKIMEDQSEDIYSNFPIQYIQTKDIIIIKHNRYIYMYRIYNQGGYKLQSRLEFGSIKIYGTLSSDSQYLVTFNEQQLQVFE